MKLTSVVKTACLLGVIGFVGAASATSYPLPTTPTGPTLLSGDIGSIFGTETGSTLQTTDFYFGLGAPSTVGGSLTSLDLTVGSGLNYSIVGLTGTLTDTTTHTVVGSGTSFELFDLPADNFQLAVSGTPTGSLGGIFAGTIAVNAVPIPSAVWLLLSGVLGVAAMTRRREPTASRPA